MEVSRRKIVALGVGAAGTLIAKFAKAESPPAEDLLAHRHDESDVTDLVPDLAGKAAAGHGHSGAYVTTFAIDPALADGTDHTLAYMSKMAAAGVAGGIVDFPGGTYDLTALGYPASNVQVRGAGRNVTILRFSGGGAALYNTDPTQLRSRCGAENLTLDCRAMTAGWRGIEIDNIVKGSFRSIFINGTDGAAGIGLKFIGGASKSTYFNKCYDVDVVANTACVDLGDWCNANEFFGGVYEGTGVAVNSAPNTLSCDTCNWFGTAMQTTGPNMINLGTGAQNVTLFGFFGLRLEPGVPANINLGASASHITFVGGSWSSDVTFADANVDNGNSVLMPGSGVTRLGAHPTAPTQTLDLLGANSGARFGGDSLCVLYRRTAGALMTDATTFEVLGTVTAKKGSATEGVMAGNAYSATGGTNTDLTLDAKGTGSLLVNMHANSGTGGLVVGNGAANPVRQFAVNSAGKVTALGTITPQVGATESRPSAASAGAGAMYYDSTLSKPIWSDGTIWRDAAGIAV